MKKYRILIVLIILVIVIGCGKKPEKSTIAEGTVITNSIEEKISSNKESVKYNFITNLYDINISMKYNGYILNGKTLDSDEYSITVYAEEYKMPYFKSFEEISTERFKIDGYDAVRIITDVKVMTMIKIDDETIIYVVGETKGILLSEEIIQEENFRNVLNSIKIDVKNKKGL